MKVNLLTVICTTNQKKIDLYLFKIKETLVSVLVLDNSSKENIEKKKVNIVVICYNLFHLKVTRNMLF